MSTATTTTSPILSLPDSEIEIRSILSCVSGSLSVIGSFGIIYLIVSDWDNKISKIRNRLLLGLSIFDVILSAALALTTVPVPEGTPNAAWAIGTSATCTTQGFFVQLGHAAFLYNASLAIYHLLAIHYKQQDRWIKEKWEKYLHIVPISFGIISAAVSAFLDLFHFISNGCYLAAYPYLCRWDDDVECTKGQNIVLFWGLFSVIPVILTFGTILFCMGRIVLSVHRQEKKLEQYDFALQVQRRRRPMPTTSDHFVENDTAEHSNNATSKETANSSRTTIPISARSVSNSASAALARSLFLDMRHTREAFIQALLYSGSFFLVIIWLLIAIIVDEITGDVYTPFWITCLNLFFRPMQGFFNFLIYTRPYYMKKKREKIRQSRTSQSTDPPDQPTSV